MDEYLVVADDVRLGQNVRLAKFINLYGCTIGNDTRIGAFVEIQKSVIVGSYCKISSHSFICEGVTIGDGCFIGHGVMFINDKYPRARTSDGWIETEADWADRFLPTRLGDNVSVGSNATILGGVTIGNNAVIGAGAVVTKDVPPSEVWVGNPAKLLRKVQE